MGEGTVTFVPDPVWFERIYVLILENHGYSQVQQTDIVAEIAQHGVEFENWVAATHPSGPNYRALFSGQIWSFNEFDGVKRPNIGDLVPVYQYNYAGIPAERHNPFLDMKSTQAKLYLEADIQTLTKPGIHYIGIDDFRNAHSGSLEVADQVAMGFIDFWRLHMPEPTPDRKDALFILFDEAFGPEYVNNHIFAGMLFGNGTFASMVENAPLNHYNFANFLYKNWNFPLNPSANPLATRYGSRPIWDIPPETHTEAKEKPDAIDGIISSLKVIWNNLTK